MAVKMGSTASSLMASRLKTTPAAYKNLFRIELSVKAPKAVLPARYNALELRILNHMKEGSLVIAGDYDGTLANTDEHKRKYFALDETPIVNVLAAYTMLDVPVIFLSGNKQPYIDGYAIKPIRSFLEKANSVGSMQNVYCYPQSSTWHEIYNKLGNRTETITKRYIKQFRIPIKDKNQLEKAFIEATWKIMGKDNKPNYVPIQSTGIPLEQHSYGPVFEDRGGVSLALIGILDKKNPHVREDIINDVREKLPESLTKQFKFEANGDYSIDIIPKRSDKLFGINHFIDNYTPHNKKPLILFFGDSVWKRNRFQGNDLSPSQNDNVITFAVDKDQSRVLKHERIIPAGVNDLVGPAATYHWLSKLLTMYTKIQLSSTVGIESKKNKLVMEALTRSHLIGEVNMSAKINIPGNKDKGVSLISIGNTSTVVFNNKTKAIDERKPLFFGKSMDEGQTGIYNKEPWHSYSPDIPVIILDGVIQRYEGVNYLSYFENLEKIDAGKVVDPKYQDQVYSYYGNTGAFSIGSLSKKTKNTDNFIESIDAMVIKGNVYRLGSVEEASAEQFIQQNVTVKLNSKFYKTLKTKGVKAVVKEILKVDGASVQPAEQILKENRRSIVATGEIRWAVIEEMINKISYKDIGIYFGGGAGKKQPIVNRMVHDKSAWRIRDTINTKAEIELTKVSSVDQVVLNDSHKATEEEKLLFRGKSLEDGITGRLHIYNENEIPLDDNSRHKKLQGVPVIILDKEIYRYDGVTDLNHVVNLSKASVGNKERLSKPMKGIFHYYGKSTKNFSMGTIQQFRPSDGKMTYKTEVIVINNHAYILGFGIIQDSTGYITGTQSHECAFSTPIQ